MCLDYEFQDVKSKLEYLKELNIPVWLMEPVRSGRLAKSSEGELSAIKEISAQMLVLAVVLAKRYAHRI